MQMEGGMGRGKRNIHHLPPPPSPGKKVCQGCFLPPVGYVDVPPLSSSSSFLFGLPGFEIGLFHVRWEPEERGEGDSFHSRLSPLFLLLFALGEKNKKDCVCVEEKIPPLSPRC